MGDPQTSPQANDPGVFLCGYSYAEGQARLHADGSAGGDYSNAWHDPAIANAFMFGITSGTAADVTAQLAGNGPIPQDAPWVTPIHAELWDGKDAVVAERHVYFYGFRPKGYGSHGHDASEVCLCLQVSGLAQNRITNGAPTWILPRNIGGAIPYYCLKAGTRLSDGQWEGSSSGLAAFVVYKQVVDAAIAIIGSAFNAGGIVGAVEKGAEQLIAALPTIANAVATGDATGLIAAVEQVVGTLVNGVIHDTNAVAAIKQAFNNAGPGGADMVAFFDSSAKTVRNVASQADGTVSAVVQKAQTYTNALLAQANHGIPGTWDQVLQTVVAQRGDVGTFGYGLITRIAGSAGLSPADVQAIGGNLDELVGKAAQDRARAVLAQGVADVNANPCVHFFDMATGAVSPEQIEALASEVPDYALEYFVTGATLRAAELASSSFATSLRSYSAAVTPRPGGGIAGSRFPVQAAIKSAGSVHTFMGF